MKLYGKKVIRNALRKATTQTREMRDATLWDVDTETKIARVKIRGSDELVYAHLPTNWDRVPGWAKPGNAVRLFATGGNRGRLEIASHGVVRPCGVPGGTALPTASTAADAIISGFGITAVGGLSVSVASGSVRFDGVVYPSSAFAITMAADSEVTMGGTGIVMGESSTILTLATAPAAGLARYDLIVVNSSLVVSVVQGTAAATPVFPDTPAGSLLCGWVLVIGGTTELSYSFINTLFTTRRPTSLGMVITDSDLAWGENTTDITVTSYDQYGDVVSQTGGFYITLTILYGDGTLDNKQGSTGSSVSKFSSAGVAIFGYTRGSSSPAIQATIEDYNATTIGKITLRDSGGGILP